MLSGDRYSKIMLLVWFMGWMPKDLGKGLSFGDVLAGAAERAEDRYSRALPRRIVPHACLCELPHFG